MFKCSHCSQALKVPGNDHFHGKDPLSHIAEVQARGVMASSEIHGAETPGSLFAFFDSGKEVALLFLIIAFILNALGLYEASGFAVFIAFSFAISLWKTARASWLAWARLERLHRVMDQERYEIETNREQEKVELKALYQAKGFDGELLDEVVDVLMADGDRLLKVMLEEELGFRLEQNEHPLVQGLAAGFGALFSAGLLFTIYHFFNFQIVALFAILLAGFFSFLHAKFERNDKIRAVIWNMAIAGFSACTAYFLLQFFL